MQLNILYLKLRVYRTDFKKMTSKQIMVSIPFTKPCLDLWLVPFQSSIWSAEFYISVEILSAQAASHPGLTTQFL